MTRWIVQPGSAELFITMVTDHTFKLLSPQEPQNCLMFMSTARDEAAAANTTGDLVMASFLHSNHRIM